MHPITECLDEPALSLSWSDTPWDRAVTGYPVWDITHLRLGRGDPGNAMRAFEAARDRARVGLVSCRLPCADLRESMFLEGHGFRFIEIVYQPELELGGQELHPDVTDLVVSQAADADLPFLLHTARTAFTNERFHVDPRLGPDLGNARYENWVTNSLHHPRQRLLMIRDGDRPVAFFITETLADDICYWHLNAVAPEEQGHGYGLRAWQTMIKCAAAQSMKRVRTTIVARNVRVLNLYARLGFRFRAPQMTLHWAKEVNG
jgi:RimJ/RimL family protein N-acetyltransferase